MTYNDYKEVYSIIPVYDENDSESIYGYIACKSYLIKENVKINDDGTSDKEYEIVYSKVIDNLNVNNYENIENQKPLFENGLCTNSVIINEIYTMFDVAKESSEIKSRNLFEQIAKNKLINPSNYSTIRDLYSLKRAIESEKSNLESRIIDLNIIEKSINGQIKII